MVAELTLKLRREEMAVRNDLPVDPLLNAFNVLWKIASWCTSIGQLPNTKSRTSLMPAAKPAT